MTTSLTANLGTRTLLDSEAQFPVELRPVYTRVGENFHEVKDRRGIFRPDTGETLEVVSDRYTLVSHAQILGGVEDALRRIGEGSAPRGVHVFKRGAIVRALFKIESRKFDVGGGDILFPVIRVGNSYDASQRVTMELGAFRRVCTNLSVGGGGIFAEGFRSIHAGEIDPAKVAESMGQTLEKFPSLVETFKSWRARPFEAHLKAKTLDGLKALPKCHAEMIGARFQRANVETVWDAYNHGTDYATHETRSPRTAYQVLAVVNKTFDGLLSNN